jgi:hypothetical protein
MGGAAPKFWILVLGGSVEVQKGYIPSCMLNDDLSMKIFVDAVWIGRGLWEEKV